MTPPLSTLLRIREGHAKVGYAELFFDLVFVFAVTQLSHTLLEHLTPTGALRTGLLFLAVWWLWICTSWVTNWLDPEKIPVRLTIFGLMLGGLMMSSALPDAFAERGLAFAVVFAAMQVGRSAFMLWALRGGRGPGNFLNFIRITLWFAMSAVLWIAGGLAEPESRAWWWLGAVAIEYLGPIAFFRVPGLGRSSLSDWDVEGGHLSERCGLFIIIALGESVLITGATFAKLEWNPTTIAAFCMAFLGSVAMWWIYFDSGAARGEHRITHGQDSASQARLAYTYLHLLIVGGIIVCAVADELVLVHPDHAETAGVVAIIGGPALYLLGCSLFKWVTNTRRFPPASHLGGLSLLAALALTAAPMHLSPLVLGAVTTVVLMIVAGWETASMRYSEAERKH
ncbi:MULTISPECIES: low temperature requirement protein A [Lysobacter]|uniref:low temperature requirement protein A n=1 Tax=Lysobacter TaxID=68 RepID=UPI001F1FB4D8|nr:MULTISPECIES: low temperature requirement protein A [Lysobacter]UJB20728.1 low temperature requirement protein A [Lysobacter capsici]UJQ30158.1 low temperature requirement protein A [Lysobacter gummosus]